MLQSARKSQPSGALMQAHKRKISALQGFPLALGNGIPYLRAEPNMRIVIQHALSRSYFNGNSWDANKERAAEFESVVEAEQVCRTQNLGNALIVLKFRDGDEDISYRAGEMSTPLRSPDIHRFRA
jgi:hypothetical protein